MSKFDPIFQQEILGTFRCPQAKVSVWLKRPGGKYFAPSKDLIMTLFPLKEGNNPGLYIITTEDGDVEVVITVDKVPKWLEPPALPKPKPIEQQLYASLMGEPWTTMLAYADALEEKGDPRAAGWRHIAQRQFYPHLSFHDYKARWHESLEPASVSSILPWDLFCEPSVSYQDEQSTMPQSWGRRIAHQFNTVGEAWSALAYAWVRLEERK